MSYFEVAAADQCVTLLIERIHGLDVKEYAFHPLGLQDMAIKIAEASREEMKMVYTQMAEYQPFKKTAKTV